MEKENLKLTNKISSLITDDLKKNRKHESLEHAAQILRNVIKLYISDRIKTDRLPDIDDFNCRDEIFKIHPFMWIFLFRFVDKITIIMIMLPWNIVLNVTQLNNQITKWLFSYAD